MKKKNFSSAFIAILGSFFLLFVGFQITAQSIIPIPPQSNTYSGNSRGMWFTAPCDFIITGVRAPNDIVGAQSVHLVKLPTAPPNYSSTISNFTTLNYTSNLADTGFIPLNVFVNTGDVIGVLAVRGNTTSYGPTGSIPSSIGPYPITLLRLGWQGNIQTSPAVDFWTETAAALGRVEIRYSLSLETDAELQGFTNIGDTLCSGNQEVGVTLKNHGPNNLTSATIDWKVNNVAQPTCNWSGNIAKDTSKTVVLGSYNFVSGTPHNIIAYLTEVNNAPDTFPSNDTIQKANIYIKASPKLTLNDTVIAVCQGDSAVMSGTLSGVPPYSFKIKHGSTTVPVTGYTSSTFTYTVNPSSTTTFFIKELSDGSGCSMADSLKIEVVITPAPPAAINAMGSTAACFGDSVSLMASVGLNLTYEWFKNGVLIPGVSNYVFAAKESGDYKVKITSPNGCSNTSQPITITIHPEPVVNLGNDTALLPNKSIKLDAGSGFNSYLWSTGAIVQQIIVDSAGIGLGTKTIWVEVKDNFSCIGKDTIKITFSNNPGIADHTTASELKIVPNPTSGKVTIAIPDKSALLTKLELYNAQGKQVNLHNFEKTCGQTQININLDALPDGVYFLRAETTSGVYIGKLLIQR